MKEKRQSSHWPLATVLTIPLLSLGGCDYWPPALQTEIDTLRTELNDVLDERQRLEFENEELKSMREGLQRVITSYSIHYTKLYELLGYIVTPIKTIGHAFAAALPDIIAIAIIVIVTRYIIRLIHMFFVGIERGAISFRNNFV